MINALWIAAGGAAGSLARYGIAGMLNGGRHPWGTVTVNLVGSLLLGLLIGLWGFEQSSPQRLGLTIGLLGGFTTFSTFTLDTIRLWEQGETGLAVVTVAISVVGGLAVAAVGLVVGRTISG